MPDNEDAKQPLLVEPDWAEKAERDEVDPEPDNESSSTTKPWDASLIRVDTRPLSVSQVLDMIDQGDLELQPEFQRRRVWRPEQKSLLIESLLLRIPLPAFYFASDDFGHLQVIDGLQRLSTIHDFVRGGPQGKNRFALESLQYLTEAVGGKYFDDLQGQVWGRRILQSTLAANVVDPQTPVQVKFNIFARLNKQGTPLSQQELRHAMSGPRSRKFLSDLASLDEFLHATDFSVRNSRRMHDIEMVLRFCAFQLTPFKYYGNFESFTDFLTKTTELLDNPDKVPQELLSQLRERFKKSMLNAISIFGRKAFRKVEIATTEKPRTTPINKPLFDVWSTALSTISSHESESRRDAILGIHNSSLAVSDFQNSISLNTGSTRSIMTRFYYVQDHLRQLEI